ncbi:hypothetical protein GIY09_10500 [Aerococcaceae bacterium WS4759]|uniref:Uncharacterized protein n=1 Tax=Fundicoccus ignavus TaxID=2664442 RepID=A0A6I2GHU3_9LACT|nr:hypothetical protein [Fundicoccus ignavus]MRI86274.1 hypothetical protein [Fundicoccus ignavus]
MEFNSEFFYYPNLQDYLEQILENIIDFLNMDEGKVGYIIIGETGNDIKSINWDIEKKNFEILLKSGMISPLPISVHVKTFSKFLEIKVVSGIKKPYIVSVI